MNGNGRGRALFLALIVLVLAAALAPARAAAQENGEDVLVRVNGAVVLPVGESADVIVAVNSESQIAGSVRDTLVVVNETATISGDVGEIVVFDGVVHLEPTARIAGDLTLVNSELDQADGAVVFGNIVQRDGAAVAAELNRVVQAVSFVAWIGMTILFLALALGWATIGGRQLSAVAGLLAARPELAVGWGLVFWIAAPLLAVAVMFTVVGIPLGIATLVIGLPLLWSLGYVATGTRLGFFVDDLRGAAPDLERPYLEALIGVGILQVIGLVPIVGGFVVALAGLLGAGAVVVHAWRRTRTAGGAGGHPSPLLDAQS